MIRVLHSPGRLLLKGHAGSGPRGQDLVCAAVSILTETLARSLPEGSSRLGNGKAFFTFSPDSAEAAFVLRGLLALQEAYPQCVEVRQWVARQ